MPANDLEYERAQVSAKRKKRVLRPTVSKRAAAFKIYHFPLCDCPSWSDVTHRKPDCQGCRSLETRGHMTTRPSGQSTLNTWRTNHPAEHLSLTASAFGPPGLDPSGFRHRR